MDLIDRGSVVSWLGAPFERAVTGLIGAGAFEVFLTGGSEANLASIFPISLACMKGVKREILAASLTLEPK